MPARYRIDLEQIAWQLIVDIALEELQTNLRKDFTITGMAHTY